MYARGGADSRHDADRVIREEDVHLARIALHGRDLEVLDPPELLERATELRVDSVRMPVLDATDRVTCAQATLGKEPAPPEDLR